MLKKLFLKNKYKKQAKTKIILNNESPSFGSLVLSFLQKSKPAPVRVKVSEAQIRKTFYILALLLMPVVFTPSYTGASLEDDLNSVNQQIDNAKDTLAGIQDEMDTLEGQVAAFNSQIYNVNQQIALTDQKIALLKKRVAQTETQIKEAETNLLTAREQLSEVIRVMYEEGQVSSLEVIAKSNSFNEFVNRSEYLEQVQFGVKAAADEVIELMNKLEAQKKELEGDKKEAEELKKSQAAQKSGLAQQRSAKDALLDTTKGNEDEYQALLAKLKKEQQNIQDQIWYGGNYVSYGSVDAGDIVGILGNSGYSTGCHLHFEIRTASKSTVNPASYIGNGYFIHPVPGVRVSAPYGYSSYYFPGVFHTGIDYADGCAGTPVRATADGEIVARTSGRPNTYPWSYEYGNYVMVRHTNGMYSLYGHLQ